MATLGQTQYYRTNVNGITGYYASPYGGNTPYGDTLINKDEFTSGLKEKISTLDKLKGGTPAGYVGENYDQNAYNRYSTYLNEVQAGTGIHAAGYVDPSLSKFQSNAPTPSEQYYTPEYFASLAPSEQQRLKTAFPANYANSSITPLAAGKTEVKVGNTFDTITTPKTPSETTTAPISLSQGTGSLSAPDANVKQIQQQLGITADGVFGPQTKSAVMSFQQANGLTVDGIIGPKTLAALQKAGSTANTTMVVHTDDKTGKITPGTTGANSNTTTNNPQTEIQNINDNANKEMEQTLNNFKTTVGESVDVSNSNKILKAITESLATPAPTSPSLLKTFNTARADLGVGPLEDQRTALQGEMDKLEADYKTLNGTETNRVVSMAQINRRKGKEQIAYEDAKRQIALKLDTVNNQLNQKYSVIDSIVKYTQADAQTAEQKYTTDFNRAITLTNVIKNTEETAKSDAEKLQDNARANVQVMMTTLKDKNIDFSKIDASTMNDISNLEVQAGLPKGFVQFAMAATDQPVISIGGEFTDTSGNRQVPIYTKNPSTGVVSTKVITIGSDQNISDINKNKENDIATAILDFQTQIKNKGWRGIDPTAYEDYKNQILKQYGSAAALDFDKAIKSAKLAVDYGTSSDAAFSGSSTGSTTTKSTRELPSAQ